MRRILLTLLTFLIVCSFIVITLIWYTETTRKPYTPINDKPSNNYIKVLPKGRYTIVNYGSRHIVKCIDTNGTIYYLNDYHFKLNKYINARDAHEFQTAKQIEIK